MKVRVAYMKDKFNNIMLKFKYWLIEKLGGYTKQQIVVDKPLVKVEATQNCAIHIDKRIALSDSYTGRIEAMEWTQRQMADELVNHLLKERAIVFTIDENINKTEAIMRAELRYVPGRDTSLINMVRTQRNPFFY